jgi:hypothetical protein
MLSEYENFTTCREKGKATEKNMFTMKEDQERGQKHEEIDNSILSPRHASGRTPCKMNNGLPSKRKVHQPLTSRGFELLAYSSI